ncbi:hypothetical protein, partial [Vibrio parahaemolyticus]|uniref:hypothetical protein n=1 Tax=Vibrio parahaemolyticus TaxID=670 RepID=UPI0019D5EC3E
PTQTPRSAKVSSLLLITTAPDITNSIPTKTQDTTTIKMCPNKINVILRVAFESVILRFATKKIITQSNT